MDEWMMLEVKIYTPILDGCMEQDSKHHSVRDVWLK